MAVVARTAPTPPDSIGPSAALADEVVAAGRRAGLARVGIASAEPFDDARRVLEERRAAGLHGGMQFTYRNPARSTDPQQALPGARSLVVAARAYPAAVPPPTATRGPQARVARYAVGDQYGALRHGLEVMAGPLRAAGWQARVLADDNALVDRAAAQRAGIGWYGKNANLLLPGAGSWFVLGAVLTDAPLPPSAPVDDGCGPCTRCLDGCPTAAIVAPGVVDARRCLAWLVQAEGVFPIEYRVALDDRLYGCDECQEVCPPNRRHRGASAAAATVDGHRVPVLEVLGSTDDELLARFGRWYIPRREPRYLRRNALVVLGNTAPVPVTAEVAAALAGALADGDALIRAHAVWAARRLGATSLLDAVAVDDDPLVRAELAAAVPARAGSSAAAGPLPAPGAGHP